MEAESLGQRTGLQGTSVHIWGRKIWSDIGSYNYAYIKESIINHSRSKNRSMLRIAKVCLLPLCVKSVVHFSVSDCKHDNQDPETFFYMFIFKWHLHSSNELKTWEGQHWQEIDRPPTSEPPESLKGDFAKFQSFPQKIYATVFMLSRSLFVSDFVILDLTAVCRFSDPFLRLITHSANCWLVTSK